MFRKTAFIVMLVVLISSFSACNGQNNDDQTFSSKEPVSESPIAESSTPDPAQSPIATDSPDPFEDTSFVRPDPAIRPFAVMIDNQGDKVLPQGGISRAQIVYEILTEYNITRYFAFFWGNMPEMIGPVRSARHYFLDYAMEYDAVYVHFGWSEFARKDISKLKINNINGLVNGDAFWDITTDKSNWQDSYTSKDKLEKQIPLLKYSTTPKKAFPFQYNEKISIPSDGTPATDFYIKFLGSDKSTCGYYYDSEKALYKRVRMGVPQIDRNTGEQVMVRNIIITEILSPIIPNDPYGHINLKNIGSGEGLYITGGKAVKIKWSKDKRDEQTSYVTESGQHIVLNPGQTWIEIVPNMSNVIIN